MFKNIINQLINHYEFISILLELALIIEHKLVSVSSPFPI